MYIHICIYSHYSVFESSRVPFAGAKIAVRVRRGPKELHQLSAEGFEAFNKGLRFKVEGLGFWGLGFRV